MALSRLAISSAPRPSAQLDHHLREPQPHWKYLPLSGISRDATPLHENEDGLLNSRQRPRSSLLCAGFHRSEPFNNRFWSQALHGPLPDQAMKVRAPEKLKASDGTTIGPHDMEVHPLRLYLVDDDSVDKQSNELLAVVIRRC